MKLEIEDLEGTATRIAIEGRLDTPGVGEVEMRFTAGLVPKGRNGLIDMSRVTFLSSMGIRMLVAVSQALARKDARIVLFGVQPLVLETLENAGLDNLVAVVPGESDALELLGTP